MLLRKKICVRDSHWIPIEWRVHRVNVKGHIEWAGSCGIPLDVLHCSSQP